MEEYKRQKEYGPTVAIFTILLIIGLSAYLIFQSSFTTKLVKKQDIDLGIIDGGDNTEIVIQEKDIKQQEIDIAEIEKRLDELDIDLDDILKELDL